MAMADKIVLPLVLALVVALGAIPGCGELCCEDDSPTEPEPRFLVDIYTGNGHSCALDDQGKAICWGWTISDGEIAPEGVVFGSVPLALGSGHSSGIDIVGLLNVAFGIEQMCFVQHHRSKAPLPQITRHSQSCIDIEPV